VSDELLLDPGLRGFKNLSQGNLMKNLMNEIDEIIFKKFKKKEDYILL